MITHTLYGGMGNQLFQMGAVIALSLKTNHEFYFEATADSLVRRCPLFAALLPYCKEPDECRALESHLGVTTIHDPADPHVPYGDLFDEVYRRDNLDTVFKLEGYFQSYRFLEGHVDHLLHLLKLREQQDRLMGSLTHAPQPQQHGWALPAPPGLAMHFRIGDYYDLQHTHPILSCSYYYRALKQALMTMDPDTPVTVVYVHQASDKTMVEEYYISRLARAFPQCLWIPISSDMSDADQLLYLSLAEHVILGNSTFSIWAAYMHRSNTQRVYYPLTWYTHHHDYTWVAHMTGEGDRRHIVHFMPCRWTTANPPLRADGMVNTSSHGAAWTCIACDLDPDLDVIQQDTKAPPPTPASSVNTEVNADAHLKHGDYWCLCYNNPTKHFSMTQRFQKLGLPLKIYPGVPYTDPRILNSVSKSRNLPLQVQRVWSVTYGHLDMIRRFLASGKAYGIFCEDDIVVNKTLPRHLPYIMKECDETGIDFLLLGYMKTQKVEGWMHGHAVLAEYRETEGAFPYEHVYHDYPDDQWGVHMYMVSRQGATRILETFAYGYADTYVNDEARPFSPDWTISKCPGVRRALLSPMLAVEDGADSYEHYGHEGQWRFHMDTFRAHYVEGVFI